MMKRFRFTKPAIRFVLLQRNECRSESPTNKSVQRSFYR